MPVSSSLSNFSWGGWVEILPNFACGLDRKWVTFIYRSIDLKRFCVYWWTRQWLICPQSRWNLKVRAGECLVNPPSSQGKQKGVNISGTCCAGCDWGRALRCPWLRSPPRLSITIVGTKIVFIGKSEINRKGQAEASTSLQKETQWELLLFFFFFL